MKFSKNYIQSLTKQSQQLIFFDNNINKLNNIEQNTCDSLLLEEECKIALKEIKITRALAQMEPQQSSIKCFGLILRGFILTL